jgi:hypothetical protein
LQRSVSLRNLGIPILGSVSRLSIGAAQRQAALQMIGVTASALLLVAVYGNAALTQRRSPIGKGVVNGRGAQKRCCSPRALRAIGYYTICVVLSGAEIQDHGPPAMPLSRANFANAGGMVDNAVDFVENCLNFDSVHESFTGVIDCVSRLQRQIFLSSGMKA